MKYDQNMFATHVSFVTAYPKQILGPTESLYVQKAILYLRTWETEPEH